MRKKILSLFLCLIMVVSILPVHVLAENDSVTSQDEVTECLDPLLQSVELTGVDQGEDGT